MSWLEGLIGQRPGDADLYQRALTHGSAGADNYERLEFLGDRVLGLCMAHWLYTLYPDDREGQLSRRFNALVAGTTCADVARENGVPARLILGKQARDDGAADSDNVLGDVMEALIGAAFLDFGDEVARTMVKRLWQSRVTGAVTAPKHPKSELQEWAASHRRKPPTYELVSRSGPQHALRFIVSVSILGVGSAQAEGGSKQEAETAAAAALLEQIA